MPSSAKFQISLLVQGGGWGCKHELKVNSGQLTLVLGLRLSKFLAIKSQSQTGIAEGKSEMIKSLKLKSKT